VLVVVCPGQGSQVAGFLTPWLEVQSFAESIAEMSASIGMDLAKHGTVSDAETIRDTAIAQPLIVGAGIATMTALRHAGMASFAGAAGHSVGEVTASVIAGVLTQDDGIKFVAKRGTSMASAAAKVPSAMAAVLGGDSLEVATHLVSIGLTPVNFNGGGQIVAAGPVASIAKLQEHPLEGTRVVVLQVAGPFHTSHMDPAVAELEEFALNLQTSDPTVTIWSNANGATVSSGEAYLASLVSQVSHPVRWDLCMSAMVDAGVTAIIEVAPAGTLVGLAKRGMQGVETLAVKTPEQIPAALELAAKHA